MHRTWIVSLGAIVASCVLSTGVSAAPVFWTDWTAGTTGPAGSAVGTLNVNGTLVTINYTGEIQFLQTGAPGETNYWNPSGAYVSPTVDNPPPSTDIIALSQATAKTITFSQPITNPLFAVVSLNGNGYSFDRDFNILSFGPGFWGNGTLTKTNPSPGVFQLNGSGEPHGVIQFQGTFSSITWTSLSAENWNGFTIGITGVAPPPDGNPIPEPASLTLLALGAAALLRRR